MNKKITFQMLNLQLLDRGINCLHDKEKNDTLKIFCTLNTEANNEFSDVNDVRIYSKYNLFDKIFFKKLLVNIVF